MARSISCASATSEGPFEIWSAGFSATGAGVDAVRVGTVWTARSERTATSETRRVAVMPINHQSRCHLLFDAMLAIILTRFIDNDLPHEPDDLSSQTTSGSCGKSLSMKRVSIMAS